MKKPTPAPSSKPPKKRAAAKPAATPAKKTPARKTAKPAPKALTPAPRKAATKPAAKRPAAKKPNRKAPPPAPAPIDEDAGTAIDDALMGLSIREARFVDRYIIHHNGSLAYVEAGYLARNANVSRVGASQLLIRPNVRAYMAVRIKEMIGRDEEHQDSLMGRLRLQAFGDARELTEHHKGSCRFCWGKFHRHQFTAGEWDEKMSDYAERQEKAAAAGKPMPKAPDAKGGAGYTWGREPNPECPECAGHGIGKTIIHDTRYLSPAAVALYAGTKEGKDGIEVRLRDADKALDTLVKIAKLYEDATVNVNIDAGDLDAVFGASMAAAHARSEVMRKERGLTGAPPPLDG